MSRTAYEVQRDFGLSSGLRSEIIWDSLSPDQAQVLKQKIEQLIPEDASKTSKNLERQRDLVFRNVWQQRRYTNGTLLSAIIYVLVTPETDPQLALQATQFTCHPVIRTRRCLKGEHSDSCCMIFVDEHGRVYANWEQYVFRNTLPRGLMIAPSRGIYNYTDEEEPGVQLMVHPTPSTRGRHRLLNAGDKVATLGGLVASVPVAAALTVPVAAPLVLAGTVVGAATVAYSTLRSVTYLVDRRRHGQSTSIADSEARGFWLGVAGGVFGLGATGATKALGAAAEAGFSVAPAAKLAVQGINVGAVVISGTGMVHGVYDLYCKLGDDEALNRLAVLQLASNLVIFTHSLNNLRIASKATNGSSLRNALRKQSRKEFGKISQESLKLQNPEAGKFDFIRTLNEIPIKEALLSLGNMNSNLTQGVAALTAALPKILSLGSGGQMQINMEMLAKKFGQKFVEHIGNITSLADVLEAMTQYFSKHALIFLMDICRNFLENNVDNIDRTLHTFVSTETVLYRIMKHCVTTFDDFAIEVLQRRSEDIQRVVHKYFESLKTINENCRKYQCSVCKGAYYISPI